MELHFEPGVLLVLGIGIFGGILSATFFRKIRFPQVVGYIALGLLLGKSGFEVFTDENLKSFGVVTTFSLGVIGFLVGGELEMETFKKYGKQFAAMLIGEGCLAFTLVSIPITLIIHYCTDAAWPVSIAGGVVFGAIASATDPASTVSVLWEERSKGVLTTSLIAIVALDDALAMTLYGIGTSIASILTSGKADILGQLIHVVVHLGGSVLIGVICALLFKQVLKKMDSEKNLVMGLSMILLAIGLANSMGMDVILASMALGCVLVNTAPLRSHDLFATMRTFSTPIYVIFFVLVGANFSVGAMPKWLWGVVVVYVIARSLGKYLGARYGAKLSKSDKAVEENLGLGLLAQGGVAIGLAIIARDNLQDIMVDGVSLGDIIVYGVTATTLIVQIMGPAMVKLAVSRAGEAGLNVTEEDVVATLSVGDVMNADIEAFPEGQPLSLSMKRFSESSFKVFPIVNRKENIVGLISLDSMKDLLLDPSSWEWMLTADVMTPTSRFVTPDMGLEDVYLEMKNTHTEMIPVINNESDHHFEGVLSLHHVQTKIAHETLKRQGHH